MLGTSVIYRDSKGHDKLATVIGTSEQTAGRIPEGTFSLLVTSPLSGRQYQRNAETSPEASGTGLPVFTRTARPEPQDAPQDDGYAPGEDQDDSDL